MKKVKHWYWLETLSGNEWRRDSGSETFSGAVLQAHDQEHAYGDCCRIIFKENVVYQTGIEEELNA